MKADCHIHMLLDGQDWRNAIAQHRSAPDLSLIRQRLQVYHNLGYTYLRDGGDRWGVGKAARSIAPEYGITYRTPLAPLFKAGHYGRFIGASYEDFQEFAALVVENRRNGSDFVKIMISGLMDFDHYGILTEEGLSAHEIRELVHIAAEEGHSVMAHCNGPRTIEAAAVAGVGSVEHGAYADPDALAAMVACGTVWVPTLSTIANLRGKGRFNEQAVCDIYESAADNIRLFASMGGLLAPGSDAGAWAVPHNGDTEYSLLTEVLGSSAAPILAAGIRAIQSRF